MSDIPIGIDLGTTYSAIALAQRRAVDNRTVRVDLIPPQAGLGTENKLLPSCVAERRADQVVAGRPAREHMRMGRSGITSAKSYMGSQDKTWSLNGEDLGPIDVSAYILRTLKESAEVYLQEEVKRAVIGVPASFDTDKRLATLKAAKEAGFDVQDERGEYMLDALIEEPTAALIQFINMESDKAQYSRLKMPSTVCIVDIGGGTTDVCVAQVLPTNTEHGLFEIEHLGVSPHALIGGDDFDLLAEDYLQKDFEEYFNALLSDLSPDVRAKVRLELAHWAERVKVELSYDRDEAGKFQVDQYIAGTEYALLTVLSKDDYEHVIEGLLGWDVLPPARPPDSQATSIMDPVLWALDLAQVQVGDINHVLLTGGMAQLWCIQRRFHDFFGQEPLVIDHPAEAVAMGAAIDYYYRTVPANVRPRGLGRGQLPEDINIEANVDGQPQRIKVVPRGTPFPTPENQDEWHVANVQLQVSDPKGGASSYNDLVFYSGRHQLSSVRFKFAKPLATGTPASLKYRVDHGVVRCRLGIVDPATGKLHEAEGRSSLVREKQAVPAPPPDPPPGPPPPPPALKNIATCIDEMRRARNESEARKAGDKIIRAPNNEEAVDALIKGIESDNVVFRKWCVITLGKIGETRQGRMAARRGVNILMDALRPPKKHNQYRLPYGFGHMQLGTFLVPTSIEAAYALGRIGDVRAINRLLHTMDLGERPGVRLAAMQALGKIGNSLSFVKLAAGYLSSTDGQFQTQAAWSIGRACSQSRPDRLSPRQYVPVILEPLLGLLRADDCHLQARLLTCYALGAAGMRVDATIESPYGQSVMHVSEALTVVSNQYKAAKDNIGHNMATMALKLVAGKELSNKERNLFDATENTDAQSPLPPKGTPSLQHLSLTFTREEKAKTLKEIIHIDDRSTRVFPVTPIDKAFLAGVISKAEELVKLANNSGGNLASAQMNSDVVTHIRGLGSIIFNQLLHSDVQSRLKDLPVGSLLTISLELDSSLLQVPWELAWDSSSFLSSKFAVGRQLAVSSCHSMEPLAKKEAAMLIIVDPTATLTSASTEADVIRDHIPDWVDVAVMTQEDVRNELDIIARLNTCRYDIIHFAGHSVFSDNNPDDTGWVISLDGTKPSAVLPAARFKSLPKENRPRLVFSNSCNAAVALDASHTAAYSYDVQSVGVGSAFLHNKVPAYIGTLFTVRDKSAAMFAGSFYEHLFSGQSMGEAMRLSRGSIIETHSPAEITWASYVLYGNPSDRLCR